MPTAVARALCWLRCPAAAACASFSGAVFLQTIAAANGLLLWSGGVPKSCGWMHLWLLAWCATFPFLAWFTTPFAFVWGLLGLLLRATLHARAECRMQGPKLFAFV